MKKNQSSFMMMCTLTLMRRKWLLQVSVSYQLSYLDFDHNFVEIIYWSKSKEDSELKPCDSCKDAFGFDNYNVVCSLLVTLFTQ